VHTTIVAAQCSSKPVLLDKGCTNPVRLLFSWDWQTTHPLIDFSLFAQHWEPKIRKCFFIQACWIIIFGWPSFFQPTWGWNSVSDSCFLQHSIWYICWVYRGLDQWGEGQHMLVWRAKPSGMSCVLNGNKLRIFQNGVVPSYSSSGSGLLD
jgi:hypothetical protein